MSAKTGTTEHFSQLLHILNVSGRFLPCQPKWSILLDWFRLNPSLGESSVAKAKSTEVTINRRTTEERRDSGDRRKQEITVACERRATERRKTPRRRQIDPTTCERDYSNEEIEFMHALDAYKRANGRMFPTCSEILEVIRHLGYVRATPIAAENTTAPVGIPVDLSADFSSPASASVQA